MWTIFSVNLVFGGFNSGGVRLRLSFPGQATFHHSPWSGISSNEEFQDVVINELKRTRHICKWWCNGSELVSSCDVLPRSNIVARQVGVVVTRVHLYLWNDALISSPLSHPTNKTCRVVNSHRFVERKARKQTTHRNRAKYIRAVTTKKKRERLEIRRE